jgi:RNA polymerase sigma-70 factor (ECF subfamily)
LGLVADLPETESEKGLLARWAAGDRAAGEALLERLLPGIYGLCVRILRRPADAEEAAQETFARLCERVRRGERLEEVRKWAATVAMNLCFDRRRLRTLESPADPGREPQTAVPPLDRADLDLVRERLEELPERYRVVLHHHFVMGFKPREIAEILGLESGTARVLLHRALAALRKKVLE